MGMNVQAPDVLVNEIPANELALARCLIDTAMREKVHFRVSHDVVEKLKHAHYRGAIARMEVVQQLFVDPGVFYRFEGCFIYVDESLEPGTVIKKLGREPLHLTS